MNKLTIMLACALVAAPASAQFIPQATAIPGSAPEGINYQGRLEEGGFPVNATKSMIFRVYSAPVAGVLLWTSPTQAVPVALGLFSAVVPVPTTVLVGGGARYLEVSIDGTLMSPRELLNSVPYALIAKSVEGNIDVSTAGLSVSANSTAVQPALFISSVTGNVGVGTGAPVTAFDVGGTAAFGSASTKSTFTAAGALLSPNVSVGTGTASTVPLYVVQAVGASSMAQFYNTGSGHIVDVQGNGSISHINGIDSRYKITPNAAANFGVTNQDYGGLALGSAGFYSGITSGGSTINGGIRELYFYTNNDFSAAKMHITQAGRVGIGNNVPEAKLHVSSGTLLVDGNGAGIKLNANGGVGTAGQSFIDLSLAGVGTAGQMYIGAAQANDIGHNVPPAGAHRFYVNNQNQMVINTNGVTLGSNGAAEGSLLITGNHAIPFTIGVSSLQIMSSGNVGIGRTNPATKLHMSSGTLLIDGSAAEIRTTGTLLVGSTATFASESSFTNSYSTQAVFSGFSPLGNGASAANGSILLGNAANGANLDIDGISGILRLTNRADVNNTRIYLDLRTQGTAVTGLGVIGPGIAPLGDGVGNGPLTIIRSAGQADMYLGGNGVASSSFSVVAGVMSAAKAAITYAQVSSMTATTSIAAGGVTSQAAPVFTINNDPDTGMFSGSANNLGLTAGGNAFLLGDNGGNIQVRAPAGSNLSTVFTGGLPFAGGGSQVIVFNDGTVNTLSINSATGHGYFDTLRGTFNIRTGAAGTATQALSIGTDQTVVISTLTATYVGGSAHVCVNDAGQIFASEAACP